MFNNFVKSIKTASSIEIKKKSVCSYFFRYTHSDHACQHVSNIEGINARYLFSYHLIKSRWLGSSPVEDDRSHIVCDFLKNQKNQTCSAIAECRLLLSTCNFLNTQDSSFNENKALLVVGLIYKNEQTLWANTLNGKLRSVANACVYVCLIAEIM